MSDNKLKEKVIVEEAKVENAPKKTLRPKASKNLIRFMNMFGFFNRNQIVHSMPFILLSDKGGELRAQFGVSDDLLGLLPGRATYIVDKQGVIIFIFNSQIRIDKHIAESLRVLKELKQEGKGLIY